MNTKQAFEKLIESDDLCTKAGIHETTRRSYRKRLKDGEKLTLETMEALLVKAGAKKVPEKWVFKKIKPYKQISDEG